MSDIFLYMALEYTSYSKAIAVFFTNTLMIPIIASIYLKEKMLKWDIVGIILGFSGMIMII